MRVCSHHSANVMVRRQLSEVGSLVLSCGSQELNSGLQVDKRCLYPLSHIVDLQNSFLYRLEVDHGNCDLAQFESILEVQRPLTKGSISDIVFLAILYMN